MLFLHIIKERECAWRGFMEEDTRIVVDDKTIYEVDLNCYHCLSEQERQKYFPRAVWGRENREGNLSGRREPQTRR